jgi:hypothetical protein
MTADPPSFDVFVSYSHRDAEAVAALDVALRSAGLKVFLDTRDVLAGDRLVEKVFDGIASAKSQIVVLSEASTTSNWVKDEISAGRTRSIGSGSRVIPVLIEQCRLPNSLAHLKYVDLRDWLTDRSFRRGGVSELLHALGVSFDPPKDEALRWALEHVVELQQLSREFTYSVAHLDGGISEMTGSSSRMWTSYKHALNDVRLGTFLLAIDELAWPVEIRNAAEHADGRGSGCFAGGLVLIEHWFELTKAPSEKKLTKLALQSVIDLREFLQDRGIEPWGRVISDRAEEAGAIRDGRELRDETRRVCEAFDQLVGDVARFAVPFAP